MTGLLLLSRDDFYARLDGDISWGPQSDKDWIKEMIKDRIVFVGYKTWETIKDLDFLVSLPKEWVIGEPNEHCQIHFGGPASLVKYPPDKLIIHRTRDYLKEGLKFECNCHKKLISVQELPDYTEIVYSLEK